MPKPLAPKCAAGYTRPRQRETIIPSFLVSRGTVLLPFCGMDEPQETPDEAAAAQLDARRIARWAALRRSAYRSRSYAVVALCACLVGAVQCVFVAVIRVRAHEGFIRPILYILAAGGLVYAAAYFRRVAAHYHDLAQQSNLTQPQTPPDFSTLSDGSQFTRNLERM
jgi:hypothetical protein